MERCIASTRSNARSRSWPLAVATAGSASSGTGSRPVPGISAVRIARAPLAHRSSATGLEAEEPHRRTPGRSSRWQLGTGCVPRCSMRLVWVCLTVWCAFLACTGQPAPRGLDGGGLLDPVGGTPSDAGADPDAGTLGPGPSDAGNSADAGAPAEPDAGAAPPDAGIPDAGPPPRPDAGVPDAGTTPFDLGETTWRSLLDPSLSRFYRWLPSRGRNRDPESVFRMEGDVLHILGLPATGQAKDFGYLASWDEFHDYRLRLEQKWGTQTFAPRKNQPRDSGLLYHLHLPDQIWPRSVEFQIMEHAVGETWMLSGTCLLYTSPSPRDS